MIGFLVVLQFHRAVEFQNFLRLEPHGFLEFCARGIHLDIREGFVRRIARELGEFGVAVFVELESRGVNLPAAYYGQ